MQQGVWAKAHSHTQKDFRKKMEETVNLVWLWRRGCVRSLGVKEMLDFLVSYFNVLHVVVLFLHLLPKGLARPLTLPITSQGGQVGQFLIHWEVNRHTVDCSGSQAHLLFLHGLAARCSGSESQCLHCTRHRADLLLGVAGGGLPTASVSIAPRAPLHSGFMRRVQGTPVGEQRAG